MRQRHSPDRMNNIGWGIFLVFAGIVWLLPDGILPAGCFYIGAGIILVGLNLIKYFKGIRYSWFMNILGILLLVKGISEFSSITISLVGVLILLLGISILISAFKKNNPRE